MKMLLNYFYISQRRDFMIIWQTNLPLLEGLNIIGTQQPDNYILISSSIIVSYLTETGQKKIVKNSKKLLMKKYTKQHSE